MNFLILDFSKISEILKYHQAVQRASKLKYKLYKQFNNINSTKLIKIRFYIFSHVQEILK